MSAINRRGGKFTAWFFLLFFFLLLVRFPYGELKSWAISEAGKKAGVQVVMSDSDFLFPFGLAITDVTFSSENPKTFFITPRLEKLVLRGSPFMFFSDEKVIEFELVNGGKGKGHVSISGGGLTVNIDTEEIKMDGLMVGNRLVIDEGTLSLSGNMEVYNEVSRGEGDLALTVRGVLLRGINPLLPEILISQLDAHAEKKGSQLLINSLKADLQGIKVKGDGKINLDQNMKKSRLALKADVDLSGAKEGPLKDYLPFLKGMVGQRDRFNVLLSGDLEKPNVKLDGKSIN
ncbi:MAG: type II secretion system protein GspN [Proteobacteria bacterium]|nr:type II secretion system protein GspN [Pseudomonadota bacterium]